MGRSGAFGSPDRILARQTWRDRWGWRRLPSIVVRTLIIGSGAREHALVRSLLADPGVREVVVAGGNAGIAEVAETISLPADLSVEKAVGELGARLRPDLVVVGPEVPLVAGAADALADAGVACFGPSRAAAQLEGSKAYAKDVMTAGGVPTARAHSCATAAEVAAALDEFGAPYVVKDDGLAAGKGVVVTSDRAEALAHAAGCERVVVEEFLDGPEVSLFVVTDGTTAAPLLPAQDFKRIGDGDSGANTGGMGAYAPLAWLDPSTVDGVMDSVVRPTLAVMRERGTPFSGLLYVGLALTARGPKVVEFNCRFGDPETQVVLALLDSPLGALLSAAATGTLADHPAPRWRSAAAVTVVAASAGYPASSRSGDVITGADRSLDTEFGYVLHAGTARDESGALVTAGGRVLSVVGVGADQNAARLQAYDRLAAISFAGSQHRTDIAAAR